MSAALDRLLTQVHQPDLAGGLSQDPAAAFLRANARPEAIDCGTCVLVCPFGSRALRAMTEEGVVIEVVAPGQMARSARVTYPASGMALRSKVPRYVVQCWTRRVVRRAAEMVVVAL